MFDLSNVKVDEGFSPINPGESVAVELEKIELSKDGDLDFVFKGTDPSNLGTFKPRFWANTFDSTNMKYNEKVAENSLKQIRQIIEAYCSQEDANKIKGRTFGEFAQSVIDTVSEKVFKGVPAYIKIVFQKNSDDKTTLPNFGSFISTERTPRVLKLSNKKDGNGIPYERILPLSEYGVSSDTIPTIEVDEDFPIFGKEL